MISNSRRDQLIYLFTISAEVSKTVAVAYLEAEEWALDDAIKSYFADHQDTTLAG